MKSRKLSAILKNQFRIVTQRSIIFLFAVIIGLVFGTAQSVFAQFPREVRVKVNEIYPFKVEQQIVADDVKAEVGDLAIARARFDKDKKEFRIQGLKEGTTRVVFSGTYLGGTGMTGMLQPTPFNTTVNVTVLPNTETIVPNQTNTADPNIYRVQINRHKIETLSIETLLGQEIAKSLENAEFIPGDNNIARGDYFGGGTIRITAIGSGKTNLTLQGEIINNNERQSVTRTIEVTVVADNNLNNAPTDSVLESLKQSLQELKNIAALAGTDERKIDLSIKYFGNFVRRVQAEILKESNLETPRQLREALLKNLRDEASRDLSRLRGQLAEIATQIRPISWHSTLSDLNIVLVTLPAKRTFSCPANPNKSHGEIYGTDRYLNISSLCGAAAHKGVITFAGGNITVEFHKGSKGDKYVGSNKNNITSLSWDRDWGWFDFVSEQQR